MLSIKSPFRNIPIKVDKKQAVFLDGMRHAVQILSFAYERLNNDLWHIANDRNIIERNGGFTSVFLDSWAFVDAVDRFRLLWALQPSIDTLPLDFSVDRISEKLKNIREVRNVADHVAQKIEQIVAMNASVLGEIKWISFFEDTPLKVKACVIRPGVTIKDLNMRFDLPEREIFSLHKSTRIVISAGKHTANLTEAYETVASVVRYAEGSLERAFDRIGTESCYPSDFFTEAELETR